MVRSELTIIPNHNQKVTKSFLSFSAFGSFSVCVIVNRSPQTLQRVMIDGFSFPHFEHLMYSILIIALLIMTLIWLVMMQIYYVMGHATNYFSG